jgi:uncharacterized protein YbjQ (UPF0145 family)
MQVSFNSALEDGRAHRSIGRVKAVGRWRGANEPNLEADKQTVLRALVREAEEYGADALVNVSFEVEAVAGPDIDGVPLRRVVATGSAVRFALAA